MSKISLMVKEMKEKWEKELLKHQRSIFTQVFDEMEFNENQEGMNINEYNSFLNALPPSYANYLEKQGTFNALAGNDGIVDINEFCNILDKLENESTNLSLGSLNDNIDQNEDNISINIIDNIEERKIDTNNQN